MAEHVDYIIIGGGSAGSVLAARLSENPTTQVVLIEAGGAGRGLWVDMPLGVFNLIGNPKTDWCYVTEPDPSINNRTIVWNAGKMLGGGGGINGQVYIRGQRDDYDGWERLGCKGWSFDDVQPFFTKGERWEGKGNFESHGRSGNLSITHAYMRTPNPLVPHFLKAAENAGLPYLEDYCSGSIDGAFHSLANQRNGRRCSAAKAYLEPARRRRNLKIYTKTQVSRVLFDGDRAVGVSARRENGVQFEIRTRGEVILSAGATQSPAILMRSGVGPADHLRSLGIPVVVDRKGVGKNLIEHPLIRLRWLVDVPSFNVQIQSLYQRARELFKYFVTRDGILTSSLVQAIAGAKTLPGLAAPDVVLELLTFIFDTTKPPLRGGDGTAYLYPLQKKPASGLMGMISRPYSRGEIRLRSADPNVHPIISPNVLGDERDLNTLVRAGKLIEKIFSSPGLVEHVVGRLDPKLDTDDEWKSFVRSTAGISYHAAGTCRMGSDADSIVDPQLRVRGVRGLRVADTSIMPTQVSGNTNAAAMMIGERGATLVLDATHELRRVAVNA
jgi:choline dehydrogenase